MTVIDPKGLGVKTNNAKIELHKEIKNTQKTLQDNLILNSFILSVTPYNETKFSQSDTFISMDKLKERNILFMLDNRQYLDDMFERILT